MMGNYRRRDFVVAMALLNGHWNDTWRDASSEAVIYEIESLMLLDMICDELKPIFNACLHGERLAEIMSRPICSGEAA